MTDNMMNDLYEKYQATKYQVEDPINPLIYILHKAEIRLDLNAPEWLWLEMQGLDSTIAIIQNRQAYKSSIKNDLNIEILSLKDKLKPFTRINTFINTETDDQKLIFMLYRMNVYEDISDSYASYITGSYKVIINANQIKKKLSITEFIPLTNEAVNILIKLDNSGCFLTYKNIEWLNTHKVISVINLLSHQFEKLINEYNLTETKVNNESKLYLLMILQKLYEYQWLSGEEMYFLQHEGMTEVLSIAQKIEFAMLKEKFNAISFAEDSPTSHLYKVLKKLDTGLPLPEPDLNYLKKRHLFETLKFAYKPEADLLKNKISDDHGLTSDDIAWCEEHNYEEIVFLWLRLEFRVEDHSSRLDGKLCSILQKLNGGKRLNDEEIVWLESEKLLQPPTRIFKTHHRLEAEFSEAEFLRTKGYWNLVNASAHWRKAENPARALEKTEKLDLKSIKPAKLTAALLTTRGGALRDVSRLEEAEECALEAIKHYPDSYNPYTLMGALCYGTGRFEEGRRWFEEAIKRGATAQDEDVEIKRILRKKEDHNNLIEYLLKRDPHRFAWVKKFQQNSH
ncbi:MAG: hypothetical protein WCI11_07755 [Candidatus Methylumidiphilus sp.]